VVRALLTTRSFAYAYSEEQLMRALEHEKARLNDMVDALKRSDAHLKSVFDASPDTLLICNAQGTIVMANRQVTPLLGYSVEELLGQSIDVLVPGQKRVNHVEQRENDYRSPGTRAMGQAVEVSARRKDGSEFPVEISLSQIEAGGSILVASAMRDVTGRKQMEEELRSLAFSDPLTQLSNRRHFRDQLKHALRVCRRHHSQGAVLLLDLNKFKLLNDTYGHYIGDQLLIEVAKRLKMATRDTDIVARLGGDEFVVLLENLDQDVSNAAGHAAQLVGKISQLLAEEYVLGSVRHFGTASIGFTLFSGDDPDPDQIIKNADAAMYESKKKALGRSSIASS
jgi:diguanylate cyclase (GGDEF)-like protein/PAS domain S-box-containing protein